MDFLQSCKKYVGLWLVANGVSDESPFHRSICCLSWERRIARDQHSPLIQGNYIDR